MSSIPEVRALAERVKCFAHERDWAQFHDAKNLAMALGSEVGELMAVLRWTPNAAANEFVLRPENRRRIMEELGDIGILLLLLCDRLGTALDEVVEDKLRLNSAKYPVERSRGRSDPPAD
jgi:dCTP diphosphatase